MHLEEDKEPKGKNPRDSNQRNISILVKKLVPPINLPISRNFPLEMTFSSDHYSDLGIGLRSPLENPQYP